MARPMMLGRDRGEHHHAERLSFQPPQDQLHREENTGNGALNVAPIPAGRPAGDQQPDPTLVELARADPRLDPSADPICTIGPSRPTEPPPPIHSADAIALITST